MLFLQYEHNIVLKVCKKICVVVGSKGAGVAVFEPLAILREKNRTYIPDKPIMKDELEQYRAEVTPEMLDAAGWYGAVCFDPDENVDEVLTEVWALMRSRFPVLHEQ